MVEDELAPGGEPCRAEVEDLQLVDLGGGVLMAGFADPDGNQLILHQLKKK